MPPRDPDLTRDAIGPAARLSGGAVGTGRWWHRLFAPVDNGWLVYFRILFGIEMLYTVWAHFEENRLLWYMGLPFHFKYYGFEWVEAWPGEWLKVHYYVLGALSVLIICGLLYRLSMALFFVGFSYVYLLDQTNYLNHYYLVCLLALVMTFLPAHRAFALDAWLRPRLRSRLAPAWTLWLLRLQVGIPYFFGGIAKLNADWLRGEPMHIWLTEYAIEFPSAFSEILRTKEAAYVFSYGGLLFDLLIVPMLLWRRTRLLGYGLAVLFHMTNAQIFDIGIFPWLMMLGTLIFFPPEVPRKLLRLPRAPQPEAPAVPARLSLRQKAVLTVAGTYLAVQFLVPFRHWVYPGDVNWNEHGHRFSWHMMLRTKRGVVRFFAYDPTSGRAVRLDPDGYLAPRQINRLASHPDMILQFARFLGREPGLGRELRRRGFERVEIRVDSWVSLNGREPQRLVDPEVDLSRQPRNLVSAAWIVPLREPLPEEPWGTRLRDWKDFLLRHPPKYDYGPTTRPDKVMRTED